MVPLAALHDKKVADMTIRASKHTTLALLFIRAIDNACILFSPVLALLVDMYLLNYIPLPKVYIALREISNYAYIAEINYYPYI
jgi:hypothetical protein